MMKNGKKFLASILSIAALSSMLVTPTSVSATPTLKEVDFDTITINQTSLNSLDHAARNRSIPGMTMSGHNYTENQATGKLWATELIELAQDPLAPATTDDRALKITLNPNTYTATPKFMVEDDIAGKKTVYDFNIMYDGVTGDQTLSLQVYGGGTYYDRSITQIYADSETTNKFYIGYHNTPYPFKLNEWQNMKIIMDCSAKKTDGSYDFAKWNATVYLNGQNVGYWTFADRKITSVDRIVGIYFVANGSDRGLPERNIYVDNWKYYTIEDGTNTTIDMTNYDNETFMNGSQIYFSTDAFISNDWEYLPVDKVVYYDNDVKIAEVTQDPFKYYYEAKTAGRHTITAEAYITAGDEEEPVATDSTTFIVEPRYREEAVIKEDFGANSNYVAGNTSDVTVNEAVIGVNWDDATNNGIWKVRGNHQLTTVDAKHGNSLEVYGVSTHSLDASKLTEADSLISSGSFKISGEYYVPYTAGNDNVMLGALGAGVEKNHGILSGTNMTNGQAFLAQKWYKFDVVGRIKDSKGYYTMYVNGKRILQNAFENDSAISDFDSVRYLLAYNTNNMIMDNLSLSKIEYIEDPEFSFNADNQTLTATAKIANQYEDKQILAIYDKTTDALKNVVFGTFNAAEGESSSTVGNFDPTSDKAKLFIWDSVTMSPVLLEASEYNN